MTDIYHTFKPLQREQFVRIAHEAIRVQKSLKVPPSLEHAVMEAARTVDSFRVGSYGTASGPRCLIGEVRYRRGQTPCPAIVESQVDADYEIETILATELDRMVRDAVEDGDEWFTGMVPIKDD